MYYNLHVYNLFIRIPLAPNYFFYFSYKKRAPFYFSYKKRALFIFPIKNVPFSGMALDIYGYSHFDGLD